MQPLQAMRKTGKTGVTKQGYKTGVRVDFNCQATLALTQAEKVDSDPCFLTPVFLRGRSVTGFSNIEEAAAGLTDIVPFLVKDMLKANGGQYSCGPDFEPHVVTDGALVTGQNPASSEGAARALLALLKAG